MSEDDSNNSRFTEADILRKTEYIWGHKRKIKFYFFSNATDDCKKRAKRLQTYEHGVGDEDDLDADLCHLLNTFVKKYNSIECKQDFEVHTNCNKNELMNIFEDMKHDKTLKEYDCFFFIILTFECGEGGREKGLHFCKDKVQPEALYKKLDEVQDMLMKPKVFLIQADSVSLTDKLHEKTDITTKGTKLVSMRIPHEADRITIMSSVPSLKKEGLSPMIQAFTDVMKENEGEEKKRDFLSLTGHMNKKVEAMIEDFRKENENFQHKDLTVPLISSTLTKVLLIRKPERDENI